MSKLAYIKTPDPLCRQMPRESPGAVEQTRSISRLHGIQGT